MEYTICFTLDSLWKITMHCSSYCSPSIRVFLTFYALFRTTISSLFFVEGIKPAVQLMLTKDCTEVGKRSRHRLSLGQATHEFSQITRAGIKENEMRAMLQKLFCCFKRCSKTIPTKRNACLCWKSYFAPLKGAPKRFRQIRSLLTT